jgi:hypothetical protein
MVGFRAFDARAGNGHVNIDLSAFDIDQAMKAEHPDVADTESQTGTL